MQNEKTLIDLGFVHYPDYDFKEIGVKGYVLSVGQNVWRAYVNDTQLPKYISLGKVVGPSGIVDRWRDCTSVESVFRHLNKAN